MTATRQGPEPRLPPRNTATWLHSRGQVGAKGHRPGPAGGSLGSARAALEGAVARIPAGSKRPERPRGRRAHGRGAHCPGGGRGGRPGDAGSPEDEAAPREGWGLGDRGDPTPPATRSPDAFHLASAAAETARPPVLSTAPSRGGCADGRGRVRQPGRSPGPLRAAPPACQP
jgi:hypothetical protein